METELERTDVRIMPAVVQVQLPQVDDGVLHPDRSRGAADTACCVNSSQALILFDNSMAVGHARWTGFREAVTIQ